MQIPVLFESFQVSKLSRVQYHIWLTLSTAQEELKILSHAYLSKSGRHNPTFQKLKMKELRKNTFEKSVV